MTVREVKRSDYVAESAVVADPVGMCDHCLWLAAKTLVNYGDVYRAHHTQQPPVEWSARGRAPRSEGVYAIQVGQYMKVGRSKNIAKRVASYTLQGYPEPLYVLLGWAAHASAISIERQLHERLRPWWVSGEWYHALATSEIANHVSAIAPGPTCRLARKAIARGNFDTRTQARGVVGACQ